ncbi:MAG: T9SS type A sorting domain-containing protein [Bacteroidetes bacterium]|nr:T9SS type A sorting domain-containing protein [Bacteroidota bacterium]
MKKHVVFILSLLLIFSSASSQTATSVANGNWTNPFVWSCTCVPTPGYTVIINTSVMLNTSFAFTSGSITINNGASLIEDVPTRDIWMNGGSLTNDGTMDVRYLWTQSGTFSNSGTLTARSILCNVNFTNSGDVVNVDSMYTTATVINNGRFLNIDSVTNGGTFANNGMCTYNQFTNNNQFVNNNILTFTDITNNGTLTNADTILAANSGWNRGVWNNLVNSFFLVSTSFLNDDNVMHDAVFNNNGKMLVMDSWYNMDTVKGSSAGSIMVQDSSYNSGWMKGSFDFCDLTPPLSSPYVDINTGTVSNGITWCLQTGMNEVTENAVHVFPNPATTELFIETKNLKDYTVEIFDSAGNRKCFEKNIAVLDISHYEPGIYLVFIQSKEKNFTQKIQITK